MAAFEAVCRQQGEHQQCSLFEPPQWTHVTPPDMNPVARLRKLIARWGAPSYYIPEAGGVAGWMGPQLAPFHHVMLKDESVFHDQPGPHFDFLYAWIRLPLNARGLTPELRRKRICKIAGMSDSVTYDPLTAEFRARCHDMPANVASAFVAHQVAQGQYDDASYDDIRAAYNRAVQQAFGDAAQLDIMRRALLLVTTQQGNTSSSPTTQDNEDFRSGVLPP